MSGRLALTPIANDTDTNCEADVDGDSQMRSSSSDEEESEPLFPSANDPTNAQTQAQATVFMPELSPPTSQDPPDENGWSGFQDDDMDLTGNSAPTDKNVPKHVNPEELFLSVASSKPQAREGYETREEAEHEPGYAWKNPKAREEYSRAMEQVVDKDFSLRTIRSGSGCFPES